MKFFIKTLGCKVNQSESVELASKLAKKGFEEAESIREADLILVNTCTVTQAADAKARQFISKASRNNGKRIIVTGCAVNNKLSGLEKIENIELIKQEDKAESTQNISIVGQEKSPRIKRSRALLKVQDGCNNHCTYCIVPLVRGESKSVPYEQVLNNAQRLIKQGFKEIVLTGVDIAAYKFQGKTLSGIAEDLLKIDGEFRLRLSSVEPQSVDEGLLSLYANNDRICSHVHIPMQSGNDRILNLMNRPYTAERFYETARTFKSLRNNIAITTDVIVGFPSETAEDFDQTKELASKIGFSKIHIFRYSKRPGTKAYEMDDTVSEKEKKKRASELNKIARSLSDKFSKKQVGKKARVLIEKKEGKYFKGLSSNYKAIHISGKADKGLLCDVIVDSYKDEKLFAKLSSN